MGEADIAAELYGARPIVGIEIDEQIADRARARLGRDALVIAGDAEVWHPEAALAEPYAIADLDAFANPYRALAVFWAHAARAARIVIFGTDGMRLAIMQQKKRTYGPLPDGQIRMGTPAVNRHQWAHWWTSFVRPYLVDLVAPATISSERKYQRAHMLYWAVVVDRTVEPPAPDLNPTTGTAAEIASVEASLLEAAQSGNVPAAMYWLEHKGGPVWAKPGARAEYIPWLDDDGSSDGDAERVKLR